MPITDRRVVIRRHDDPFLSHQVINSPAGPAVRSSHSKSVDGVIELLHKNGHTSAMTHAELNAFYEVHGMRLSKDRKTEVYQRLRQAGTPSRALSSGPTDVVDYEDEPDDQNEWGFSGFGATRRCQRTDSVPPARSPIWF
jgi:hypothetical protein